MSQYSEGLNYVPILAQNLTPPTSSRSRLSMGKKSVWTSRSQRSFVCYNGNYEGDITMFKDRGFELERLNLVDTESEDNDFEKEVLNLRARMLVKKQKEDTVLWRLLQFLLINFLKPDMQEKVTERLELIMQSRGYRKFIKCYQCLACVLMYVLHLFLRVLINLAYVGHIMWKRRLIFRNMVRSLLWWMTLAKCTDLALFALVLICVPLVFLLALIGFIIALCGCIKDVIQRWSSVIKAKLN